MCVHSPVVDTEHLPRDRVIETVKAMDAIPVNDDYAPMLHVHMVDTKSIPPITEWLTTRVLRFRRHITLLPSLVLMDDDMQRLEDVAR